MSSEPSNKKEESINWKKLVSADVLFWIFVFIFIVYSVVCKVVSIGKMHTPVRGVSVAETDVSTYNASSDVRYTKDSEGMYILTGPVMDTAGVMDSTTRRELDSYLRDLDSSTGIQIVVLTVDTLDGVELTEYSMRYAQKWKLGQADKDNGVLLLVSMQDRGIRIETGYGSETLLTDEKCSGIIRDVIVPKFKQNDYSTGIAEAVKNMAGILTEDDSLISKDVLSRAGDSNADGDKDLQTIITGCLCLIIAILTPFRGSKKGRTRRSSSRSSFSSGRSFSGGGGHFGGGGASGSW